MKFDILDPNVDTWVNVLVVIANILNLIYNIPQMVKTYKTRSTRDLSGWFFALRIVTNILWTIYAIAIDSALMTLNNIVTVGSSAFVGYFKIIEVLNDNKIKKINKKILDESNIDIPLTEILMETDDSDNENIEVNNKK